MRLRLRSLLSPAAEGRTTCLPVPSSFPVPITILAQEGVNRYTETSVLNKVQPLFQWLNTCSIYNATRFYFCQEADPAKRRRSACPDQAPGHPAAARRRTAGRLLRQTG